LPVAEETIKHEAKESPEGEPKKKEEKKISRGKDKLSKPSTGGLRKIFRIKKPE
jgi:hypothetical protein